MPSKGGSPAASLVWPVRLSAPVLALLAVTFCLATWGFIQAWVFNYAPGEFGNYYSVVWICGFAWVLCIQAAVLMRWQGVACSRPARFWAWIWYGCWMFCCCLIILVGLGIALPGQFAWAFLWCPPIAVILAAACSQQQQQHRTAAAAAAPSSGASSTVDVEVGGPALTKPAPCSTAAWRKAGSNFLKFCGWSSMFWLSILGFFLAMQAAWLASDDAKYPPPGQLYSIPIEGSTLKPQLHIYCKGPKTPGLSTFIMEGGGGSPGVSYDPLVDKLAAAGRRACWYDRLGYGWSDDAVRPTTTMRATLALKALLDAASEAPPFIVVGHSVGGQLAQLFAATYPSLVSGLVLLDSYNDAAIALQYMGAKNVTVAGPNGTLITRPNLHLDPSAVVGILDSLRALTPLGWARFITNKPEAGSSWWSGAMNAAYGNNKEWQSQWVEMYSQARGEAGPPLADLLTQLAGKSFWQGMGWPSLGAKPVLLLPAAATLALPPGCDADLATNATCQAAVEAKKGNYYAQLYLAYKDTLSSNATLTVLKGSHAVWEQSEQIVQLLLAKFAGV